jgi:hypothetical protein
VLAAENVSGNITAHLWNMVQSPISAQMTTWALTDTMPGTIWPICVDFR